MVAFRAYVRRRLLASSLGGGRHDAFGDLSRRQVMRGEITDEGTERTASSFLVPPFLRRHSFRSRFSGGFPISPVLISPAGTRLLIGEVSTPDFRNIVGAVPF